MAKKVIGYKGFDKDLKCRDMQYKVGKTFKHNGDVSLCSSGLHFVENPLDILRYYLLTDSRFALVEATGVSDETSDDSKRVAHTLRIKAELGLPGFIKAAFDYIYDNAEKTEGGNATSGSRANSATSGDDAHSATSGNYAHSATSGNYAHSATSGYGAHSATSTDNGIACAVGRKAKAKASEGSFIVLAEWYETGEWTDAYPLNVKSAKVDGKKVKADQWYKLVGGKFVETDDSNE